MDLLTHRAVLFPQGAHTTAESRDQKSELPSIFDYLAQESLKTSLEPGFKAAFKLFIPYMPPRLTVILQKRFDEFYLLFQLFLENHHLKRFSGSFAENFYGIKRVPFNIDNSRNTLILPLRHRLCSLITLVVFPYIVKKVENFREQLQQQGNINMHAGWRSLFYRWFPHLKALFLFIIMLFQVSYTFSWSTICTPLLLFDGCRLERLNTDDITSINAAGAPLHMRKKSIFASFWRFLLWFPATVGRLLSYGLFFLQFLENYYTDDLGKQFNRIISGRNISIPEYPYHKLPTEKQVICMETDKCPLCKQKRQNDTVLSVSGYVFCHSCIYNFILLEHRCPITSLPATTNELVKIYS